MRTSSKVLRREACPSCQAKGRDTSENNLAVYDDGHKYCYAGCGLIEGKEQGDLSEFTYEYLPLRGITAGTFKFFDCKTKIDSEGKPVALGFKYPNGAYKVRRLDRKDFYTEGDIGKAGLFGRDKFSTGSHKYVTITEGELDAASLYQVLQSPVVSVQSASSALRDCSADRDWLNGFERVYLAFDGDRPGLDAARAVAKLFDYNKVYHVRFTRSDRKDANDYLQHGDESELRSLWWNSRRYLPETVVSAFSDFEQILSEKTREGIPYPFPTLNYMTYGIRTGESVLITAQEGVGKTELMHAIEYKILKETPDDVCVAAIFLEEPKRRHLEAIAGLELKKPAHLPDVVVGEGEILSALKKAVRQDERLHVYSHFGSDDPDVLLDEIRFLVVARGCRYVLLDHITMAVSGLAGEDERKALDYLSTRLEMMVKELDFALILVSHVNDEGLTRGSRYISKIVDIRIDISRDKINPDPVIRNTTTLIVSKNRFCGRTGPAGELKFDPATYTYSEEVSFSEAEFALQTSTSTRSVVANDNEHAERNVA